MVFGSSRRALIAYLVESTTMVVFLKELDFALWSHSECVAKGMHKVNRGSASTIHNDLRILRLVAPVVLFAFKVGHVSPSLDFHCFLFEARSCISVAFHTLEFPIIKRIKSTMTFQPLDRTRMVIECSVTFKNERLVEHYYIPQLPLLELILFVVIVVVGRHVFVGIFTVPQSLFLFAHLLDQYLPKAQTPAQPPCRFVTNTLISTRVLNLAWLKQGAYCAPICT